jgi:hypothetical protein
VTVVPAITGPSLPAMLSLSAREPEAPMASVEPVLGIAVGLLNEAVKPVHSVASSVFASPSSSSASTHAVGSEGMGLFVGRNPKVTPKPVKPFLFQSCRSSVWVLLWEIRRFPSLLSSSLDGS